MVQLSILEQKKQIPETFHIGQFTLPLIVSHSQHSKQRLSGGARRGSSVSAGLYPSENSSKVALGGVGAAQDNFRNYVRLLSWSIRARAIDLFLRTGNSKPKTCARIRAYRSDYTLL